MGGAEERRRPDTRPDGVDPGVLRSSVSGAAAPAPQPAGPTTSVVNLRVAVPRPARGVLQSLYAHIWGL